MLSVQLAGDMMYDLVFGDAMTSGRLKCEGWTFVRQMLSASCQVLLIINLINNYYDIHCQGCQLTKIN